MNDAIETSTPAATPVVLEEAVIKDDAVELRWSTGEVCAYLSYWLRENCPTDGDSLSGQRLLDLTSIPLDINPDDASIKDGVLHLIWPDGHKSSYQPEWLQLHRPVKDARLKPVFSPEPWDRSLDPETLKISYEEVMSDDGRLCDAMDLVARTGLCRITGTPPDATATLGRRFAYLHDTNYGLLLDVQSEVKAWFRVLSTDAIPPHTDNAYRYVPTGITFFHCVQQIECDGGESYYVDGLSLAQRILDKDPEAFAFLCDVPLTFHRKIPANAAMGIDAAWFKAEASVFRKNAQGQVVGLRYHPRTVAPFSGDEDQVKLMYRARRLLEQMSLEPSLRVEYQAKPGETTIYDNQRVMHARHSFENAQSGVRQFIQCHIDREELHSKLRLLSEKLGRDPVDKAMAPGAAF